MGRVAMALSFLFSAAVFVNFEIIDVPLLVPMASCPPLVVYFGFMIGQFVSSGNFLLSSIEDRQYQISSIYTMSIKEQLVDVLFVSIILIITKFHKILNIWTGSTVKPFRRKEFVRLHRSTHTLDTKWAYSFVEVVIGFCIAHTIAFIVLILGFVMA